MKRQVIAAALVVVPAASIVAVLACGDHGERAPAPRVVARATAPAALHAPAAPAKAPLVPAAPAAKPTVIAPAATPVAMRHDAAGHDHAFAPELDQGDVDARARAAASKGADGALAAIASNDVRFSQAVAEALLDDPMTLVDRKLLQGLLSLATSREATLDQRLVALDLLGRAPGTDASALEKIAALSIDASAPNDVRTAALGAISQLALDREDLIAPTRTALLAFAEKETDVETRADALDAIRTEGASASELQKIAAHLGDRDAGVRGAVARALGASDPETAGTVIPALERALVVESDADTASAALATSIRVARADADPFLARVAKTPVVRDNPELARQVQDYRDAIAKGETDPIKLLQIHDDLEDTRSDTSLAPDGE